MLIRMRIVWSRSILHLTHIFESNFTSFSFFLSFFSFLFFFLFLFCFFFFLFFGGNHIQLYSKLPGGNVAQLVRCECDFIWGKKVMRLGIILLYMVISQILYITLIIVEKDLYYHCNSFYIYHNKNWNNSVYVCLIWYFLLIYLCYRSHLIRLGFRFPNNSLPTKSIFAKLASLSNISYSWYIAVEQHYMLYDFSY